MLIQVVDRLRRSRLWLVSVRTIDGPNENLDRSVFRGCYSSIVPLSFASRLKTPHCKIQSRYRTCNYIQI